MSSNRLIYDQTTYSAKVSTSKNTLDYILNKNMHENDSKCFHAFGLQGGRPASIIKGNQTDLESSLRGQGHPLSKLGTVQNNKEVILESSSGKTKVDTRLNHLSVCQMFGYKSVPLPNINKF